MGRIIDTDEVQRELNRAARDASRGPADVRAGRFVHANAGSQHPATAGKAPSQAAKGQVQANSKAKR